MGRDAFGGRCRHDVERLRDADLLYFGTAEVAGEPPKPITISQSRDRGMIIESAADFPIGCEVTILLREICSIRGRVEAFGQGRMIAGLVLDMPAAPSPRPH
jgi:hypothetical protein